MRQPTYMQRVSTPHLTTADRVSLAIPAALSLLAGLIHWL